MMRNQLGNNPDLEQLIKDAKYARMEFVRKNFRFFAYGSSFLGLLCAFAITVLAVGSANRYQQATQKQTCAAQKRHEACPCDVRFHRKRMYEHNPHYVLHFDVKLVLPPLRRSHCCRCRKAYSRRLRIQSKQYL
jgi:hypothetical protein